MLDLFSIKGFSQSACKVVAGFAGHREEVEWQLATARELGLDRAADLQHQSRFWMMPSLKEPAHLSVLPSQITEAIRSLGVVDFVARAGNGVIYYRGGMPPPKAAPPLYLMQRLKDIYDPKHIFPDLPS